MADEKKTKRSNVLVARGADKTITLPEKMSYDEAIEWLGRIKEEESQPVKIYEWMQAFPLDGAYALMRALARTYGWTGLIPTPPASFFEQKQPPTMVGLEIAPGQTVQVPWGRMQVPGIDGYIETSGNVIDGKLCFVVAGQVKRMHEKAVHEITALTRKILKEESVYKGKAVRISFRDNEDEYTTTKNPVFINTDRVKVEELVFPEPTNTVVRDSLFTPIEKTAQCRQYKIPLKRGILLEGPFGTGKTLTAYVTAKKCIENGWTFFYLENTQDLKSAIYSAQQYQPAVIFAEDIDQATSGDRNEHLNGILNVIDGVEVKDNEIIVVVTTNDVESINKAMLRPGRLDAVVSVRPPDAIAAEKLLRLYGRGLISPTCDTMAAAERLAGQIPSMIREVVERSKLSALRHLGSNEVMKLETADLMAATESMMNHVALMKEDEDDERGQLELFADGIGKWIQHAIKVNMDYRDNPSAFPDHEYILPNLDRKMIPKPNVMELPSKE